MSEPSDLDCQDATGTAPDAQWFENVADHSGVVFFILRVRPDVSIEFSNSGMRTQLVGRRFDTTTGDAQDILSHVAPESAATVQELLTMRPGDSSDVELKWRHADGHPVYTRGWVHCRERPDDSVVVEGALQDISRLRVLEEGLRNSERRHRLLAQNAWDVVWTMGLEGSITYVSPAVERVRGFTPEEAMNQSLEEIHPPSSAASVGEYFAELSAAIEQGTEPPTFRGELEYYRRDGSIMTGELQVIPHVDDDGRVVEILGVTRDVSERKAFEAELTKLAVTDPLTALWNRRHTSELLAADLAHAEPYGPPLTLLMIDIDRFKVINDTYGHQTGDRVLSEVATRLRDNIRNTDVAGRWGGEEFVILLRHRTPAEGIATAEKLRRRIANAPILAHLHVSVSIGAATRQPGEDLASWLARADAALYQAKRAGRNTIAQG